MNKHFHNLVLGVSVLPALLVMPAMAVDVVIDTNDAVVTYADHNDAGGALKISDGSNISASGTNGVVFENNKSTDHGAGLYYKNGSADSKIVFNTDVTFDNNEVLSSATSGSGAGMFVSGGNVSLLGLNNTFTNNQMNATIVSGRQYKVGGGAIANQSYVKDSGNGAGTAIDSTMVIGRADGTSVNTFTGNTSTTNGGAIMNRAVDTDGNAYLTINGTTTFKNNHANINGGAIYNVKRDNEAPGHIAEINMTDGTYTFTGNTADANGGAIYNASDLTISDSTFKKNTATGTYTPNSQNTLATYSNGKGGAIYNSGSLTVGGVFENNAAFHGGAVYNNGTLTISNGSTFGGNYANVEGGAIANYGDLNIGNNVTFNNNKAFIKDGDLDVTSGGSEMGAAIYSEGTGATRTVNIGNNVKFINNYSPFGNVYFLNANNVTIGDNVEFSGNSSQKAAGIRTSNTGAGTSTITIGDNAKFVNNTVTSATGAAAIRLYDDNVTIGKNAVFSDNTGTAVYNGNSELVFGSNVTFSGNNANAAEGIGGALVNHGVAVATFDDGVFSNNAATLAGGAIYNKENATVKFMGDLIFSGNTANGKANDIHNLGTVNVASGTTTLDGGITGTGTLTIADGATLNIETASIEQNSMALDGALNATLLNTNKFASLDVAEFTSETGAVNLSLKGTGTYKVFKDSVFGGTVVADSDMFAYNWNDNGDTITVSMKPVEEIAANTGLKSEAAVAVSHVAEAASKSDSAQLQDLSLKIQEKLAEANTNPAAKKEVEHATDVINPEAETVKQSVSTSVQNTVVNLAIARMAAPSAGRNGGDVEFTKGGVWAQGLYNKTKKNDQFTGYTRGVAAGIDGTINKDVTVGLAYAFNHSDVSLESRDTNIDSNTIFLYGQYKPSDWYVNAVLNYTFSNYEEEGTALGTRVTANYKSNTFGGQVMTGYDFASGITPELGLRYLHINGADYTNSLGIKNELKSSDYLTAMLGTKYGFDVVANDNMLFRPELHYAVKYDMISDKSSATVTMPGVATYAVNGDRLSRIGGEFGIGLTMKYKELDLSLNYDIDVREDYTSQTGMLKARYNF